MKFSAQNPHPSDVGKTLYLENLPSNSVYMSNYPIAYWFIGSDDGLAIRYADGIVVSTSFGYDVIAPLIDTGEVWVVNPKESQA